MLLPSGETEEIAFYDATTARGVLRDIHLKPATYTQNIPTLTYVTPSGKELTLSESDNIGLREGIKSNVIFYAKFLIIINMKNNIIVVLINV